MSKPWIHALSSAKKFGGEPEDYLDIHSFMDSSKMVTSTNIHRALTHNSWFIGFVLPAIFGEVFVRQSDGKTVSTRDIGEQHVEEDFKGFIPSASDFLDQIQMQPWMMNGKELPPSFKKTTMKKETQNVADTNTGVFYDGSGNTEYKKYVPLKGVLVD